MEGAHFLLQVSFRDGAATTVAFAAGPAFPFPAIWTSLEIPQRVGYGALGQCGWG
jgi:hypothetical protein